MTAQRLRQEELEAEFRETRRRARDEFEERWGAGGLKGMMGFNRASEKRARLRLYKQGRQKEAEKQERMEGEGGDDEGGEGCVSGGNGQESGRLEGGEVAEGGHDGGHPGGDLL